MSASRAGKAPLRAVAPDEMPARRVRLTVAAAAETGDPRALLVAMRERIAATVSDPKCPPRDLAALTRRLHEIAKELDALDRRAREEASEDGVAPDEECSSEAF